MYDRCMLLCRSTSTVQKYSAECFATGLWGWQDRRTAAEAVQAVPALRSPKRQRYAGDFVEGVWFTEQASNQGRILGGRN